MANVPPLPCLSRDSCLGARLVAAREVVAGVPLGMCVALPDAKHSLVLVRVVVHVHHHWGLTCYMHDDDFATAGLDQDLNG